MFTTMYKCEQCLTMGLNFPAFWAQSSQRQCTHQSKTMAATLCVHSKLPPNTYPMQIQIQIQMQSSQRQCTHQSKTMAATVCVQSKLLPHANANTNINGNEKKYKYRPGKDTPVIDDGVHSKLLPHAKLILIFTRSLLFFVWTILQWLRIWNSKWTHKMSRIFFSSCSRHECCEFGYKSWKFQILPILSAMQGSAPAHKLHQYKYKYKYKYKYSKDVWGWCEMQAMEWGLASPHTDIVHSFLWFYRWLLEKQDSIIGCASPLMPMVDLGVSLTLTESELLQSSSLNFLMWGHLTSSSEIFRTFFFNPKI